MDTTHHAIETINALFERALAAHREGNLDQAQLGYRQVLALHAQHADALHLLGATYYQKDQLAEAEQWIRQALSVQEHALYLGNLGAVLQKQNRATQAIEVYRRLIALQPHAADAHYQLGQLLQANAQTRTEAQAAYERVIALQPEHADAHNNLGLLLHEQGNFVQAQAAYQRAITINPQHAHAHYNLGNLFKQHKRFDAAQAAYRQVIALKPDYADAYNNWGNLLKDNAHLDAALTLYQKAIELNPDDANVHANLGNLLQDQKRWNEAEATYNRALELNPNDPQTRFGLSCLLLRQARYAQGWPLYESRHAANKNTVLLENTPCTYPQWQGEPLQGKSLVLWPEQGFGDLIQYARYAPLLKQHYGVQRLTLLCRPALAALLQTVAGIDAIVTNAEHVRQHDYWCFFMSLPLYCGTNAENLHAIATPYLHALPERVARWQPRLATEKIKVGLVWKGSAAHKNDAQRSLPSLSVLQPLWSVPGIQFMSLQKGQAEDEAAHPPADQPLMHVGTEMQDFADTAAIVSQLDLIICVDTAIAHVAGALGKPCWVLLPAIGTDWRWQLERSDSPWYPSLRLFRQEKINDWASIIATVTDALKLWVAEANSTTRPLQ